MSSTSPARVMDGDLIAEKRVAKKGHRCAERPKMIPDEQKLVEKPAEVKILLEINPGRWGKVFHLFDKDNREIALHQKDAVSLARNILKIAKEQSK